MAQRGYIKVDRELLEHWIWANDEPFSKGQAWVDLLMLANHKGGKTVHNGNVFEHKRGCVYRSILWLSDRWKWSRGKTKRFLDLLCEEGMVTIDSTTNGTTIRIENYDKRQNKRATNGTTDDTTDGQRSKNQSKRSNFNDSSQIVREKIQKNGTTGDTTDGTTQTVVAQGVQRFREQPTVQPMEQRTDNARTHTIMNKNDNKNRGKKDNNNKPNNARARGEEHTPSPSRFDYLNKEGLI